MKKLLALLISFALLGIVVAALVFASISSNLPQIMKMEDYHPLLVTEVYARGGEKIGEYARENRILVPIDKVPKHVINSFLAAEDDQFFQHKGLNYLAILRAFSANMIAGRTKQGGSTITQQVAKSLLLSPERSLIRKLREAILAQRMEENLSKQDILYLYLNQIYFGGGAYGIESASQTYFRKPASKLTIAETAILAGLPQAPSRYSPIENPHFAKERQRYVINRMAEVGFISQDEAQKAHSEPVKIYIEKDYKETAPYFVETLRLMLVKELGENMVLDGGLRVQTSIDYNAQIAAQNELRNGLRELDKRQGYRGPLKHIDGDEEINKYLLASRKKILREKAPYFVLSSDGKIEPEKPLTVFHKKDSRGQIVSNIPEYIVKNQIIDAVVTKVDDESGLTHVLFADGQGLIDLSDMEWARKPDPKVGSDFAPRVKKPSTVLKTGDVIKVKVLGEKFYSTRLSKSKLTTLPNFNEYALLSLEQDPIVQGAVFSIDQKTADVIALVGGYEFIHKKNEFNRVLQAKRQTGSSFKAIIYTSALDKGYTPATPVQDAPIVFEEKNSEANEGQDETKVWKPHNYENKFTGDILFRNALIRSMNIPTVKILEDVGIDWAIDYSRRLGIFSPLNHDLSLSLGSSGVTLYEMTKVFAQIGQLGRRIRPIVIHKVTDHLGKPLLEKVSLDARFDKELKELDTYFEEKRQQYVGTDENGQAKDAAVDDKGRRKVPRLYFSDPDQLISPQTAYLMTSILAGSINESGGTAARARALGRPAAGKTGTTSGYFDTWFIGYTPQVATGVWVGFDEEKSLGIGEAGGRTALPIWVEYMKTVHKDLPAVSFPVPPGIVFANIDNTTGKLASAAAGKVVNQAFAEGATPADGTTTTGPKDDSDFYKQDLTE